MNEYGKLLVNEVQRSYTPSKSSRPLSAVPGMFHIPR
jgi:hypothetical protein